MNNTIKTLLKSIGFFLIGFSVLGLVYYHQNKAHLSELIAKGEDPTGQSLINKIIEDFGNAHFGILAVVLFCFMISNASRALRWQMLLEPLGKKPGFLNSIGSIMAAYMVNLGIPRSGEFVRAGILSKYEDIPAEKVMGTIVTGRVMDVLSLLLMIALAFACSFGDMYHYFESNLQSKDGSIGIMTYLLVGGIAGLQILGLFYWKRETLLNSKLGQKLLQILKGFWEGIRSVFKLKNPFLFIFHSAVIWIMYYLMTYLSFFAFAPTAHLGPIAGLVVFVFGTLGIVFPAPGGMGSYQYLVTEALTTFYGLGIGDASSFANIVFFAVTIFCNVIFGLISFILLPVINRK